MNHLQRLFLPFLVALLSVFLGTPTAVLAVGEWAYVHPLTVGIHNGQRPMVTLQNGKVLLIESNNYGNNYDRFSELYDEATDQWTATSATGGNHLTNPILLNSGKVLVAGSEGFPELYNPLTGVWEDGGVMADNDAPNLYSTLVKLQDGRVLSLGGAWRGGHGYSTPSPSTLVELYDPATNTWSLTGELNTSRFTSGFLGGAAVLLNDGKVLAAGGAGYMTETYFYPSTELYDPATGEWTYTSNLHDPRRWANMVKLANGKVLMVGQGQNDVRECELYDPETGTWTVTGSLHYNAYANALLLPDGRVFALSWEPELGKIYAELYDPATGEWTVGAPVLDNQNGSVALLPSGNVLLAGGYINGSSTEKAQIFYVNGIPNRAPLINPIAEVTGNEGDTVSISGSFTDSDSTSWTGKVDYGDGTGEHVFTAPDEQLDLVAHTFTLRHVYADNKANDAPYQVTVKITDAKGATGTQNAQVTVKNVKPTVSAFSVSPNPVQLTAATTATVTFTDPGKTVDAAYTAYFEWGDGTPRETVPANWSNGSGSVAAFHTYQAAGVYPVRVQVTDKDGAVSEWSNEVYVSVYDPTPQGLFSAGQKFNSPTGAYRNNPSVTGTVMFGLSYKYKGDIPVGNRQFTFDFPAADFEFNATTIASLVIANNLGTLRGSGTITNRSGVYDFLVIGKTDIASKDTIRIKITDPANNNAVLYDTQLGASETADPTTTLTAGNVIVH